MASHKKDASDGLSTLTFIKAKAISSNLREVELSSDDLILCENLLMQHRSLTFFDGLHASVALNNGFTIVSNEQIYDELSIRRLPFKEFLDLLSRQFSAT